MSNITYDSGVRSYSKAGRNADCLITDILGDDPDVTTAVEMFWASASFTRMTASRPVSAIHRTSRYIDDVMPNEGNSESCNDFRSVKGSEQGGDTES